MDQLPVIEDEADPQVVHEHREPGHDRDHTPWTAKLIPRVRD